MAACNPYRKLNLNTEGMSAAQKKAVKGRLAFDVLPPPTSLLECMWNYGALT